MFADELLEDWVVVGEERLLVDGVLDDVVLGVVAVVAVDVVGVCAAVVVWGAVVVWAALVVVAVVLWAVSAA